jgi:hypothetical protein
MKKCDKTKNMSNIIYANKAMSAYINKNIRIQKYGNMSGIKSKIDLQLYSIITPFPTALHFYSMLMIIVQEAESVVINK